MSRRVREVVVVGRDAAAWLTALALQRAFGRTGVRVRMVELPSLLTAADVFAAVPSLGGLHTLLGLTEDAVLAATGGVTVLGQRFANWSKSRPPFVHGYQAQRVAIEEIDFLQFWVKARAEGLKVELEDFSLAAAAAKQGKAVCDDGSLAAANASSGYHLDARAYVALLRERAAMAGVESVGAGLVSVQRDGDRIVSVTLDGGRIVPGDLFIDASGTDAVLASGQPGSVFESWSHWYAADRILTVSAKALKPLPGFAQIAAFGAGWVGLHPLRDRTAVVAVYDSTRIGDADMVRDLPALTGMNLEGEATVAPLAPGMRRAWTGNCICVGEAAIGLEPLDAVSLHLIHMGLSHLITLFPVDAEAMPESEIYNADLGSHVANVRDFQLTHYKLNQRFDDAFWDRARDMAISQELEARMRVFAARGRVIVYDDETFEHQNWLSIFVGHGLIPRSYDPRVDGVPPEKIMERFRNLLGVIADEVRTLPSVEERLSMAAR